MQRLCADEDVGIVDEDVDASDGWEADAARRDGTRRFWDAKRIGRHIR